MAELKFNLKACLEFVESLNDISISVEGTKKTYDPYTHTIMVINGRENIKTFLKKFLIECKEKSELKDSAFLEWLSSIEQHWAGQQARIIGICNREIETATGDLKPIKEKEKNDLLHFFWNTRELISRIEKDVLDGFQSAALWKKNDGELWEEEPNAVYLFKNGKRVSSTYDFLKDIGFVERMQSEHGFTINPTHNFELLKETRRGLFEEWKTAFIEERTIKKLQTNEFEMLCFYYAWLKQELDVIKQWLSDKYPNGEKRPKHSTSDQIEILKYKHSVEVEIEVTEKAFEEMQPKLETGEIQESETKTIFAPIAFKDIFANEGWEKYITALEKTEPALINSKAEFVGQPKKHKGVICSWIKYLQGKGIVKQNANRSQLASVLNNEIRNFNLGANGKTFDNVSKEFEAEFKEQLITLTA